MNQFSKIENIDFIIKVPLPNVENTNLEQVAKDIKSSLEREKWRITSVEEFKS